MDLTTPSPPSASAPSAPPASLIDFAALRREREARHGPPPKPGPAPAPPTAVQVHHDPPAKRRALESRAASGPKSGPAVFVGGAVKDGSGRHTLRPPQVPADAYEVDAKSSPVHTTFEVTAFPQPPLPSGVTPRSARIGCSVRHRRWPVQCALCKRSAHMPCGHCCAAHPGGRAKCCMLLGCRQVARCVRTFARSPFL